MEPQQSVTLACHANDFYCYNYQGPIKTVYRGERSHFHIHVNEVGLYTLQLDVPAKRVMIIGPDGHMVMVSRYGDKPLTWMAKQSGKYLMKIWTGSVPDNYNVTISGPNTTYIEQLIWSPATSSKDGTLYEKSSEVHRSHSRSKFDDTDGRDRKHQPFR
jgi:hypothetical protein